MGGGSTAAKKSLSHPGRVPHGAAHGGRWPTALVSATANAPVVVVRPPSSHALERGTIAWLATLQAKGRRALAAQHLRWREPKAKPATLHVVLLDTSGSMRQAGRLALAKGYATQVLDAAARAGDHVALLCFGGQGVELLVPPGPARRAASVRVQQRGGGGGTPLAHAMAAAEELVFQHHRRSPSERGVNAAACTVFWLLTDGRTHEQPPQPNARYPWIVVDFDDPRRAVGRCAEWAARWGVQYRRMR